MPRAAAHRDARASHTNVSSNNASRRQCPLHRHAVADDKSYHNAAAGNGNVAPSIRDGNERASSASAVGRRPMRELRAAACGSHGDPHGDAYAYSDGDTDGDAAANSDRAGAGNGNGDTLGREYRAAPYRYGDGRGSGCTTAGASSGRGGGAGERARDGAPGAA